MALVQRSKFFILTICFIAGCLRVMFAFNLPLSGDEVGVGILQASGQAVAFKTLRQQLSEVSFSRDYILGFVNYADSYSWRDTLTSLQQAGMHPPLYYLLVRSVLKYVGNHAFILRLVSVCFAVGSIPLLYRIGKTVHTELTGIYSAVFFTISAYGIVYGTMVRPYPLAMFLALWSTDQALHLSTSKDTVIPFGKLALYGLTLTLGMYTIYHFVFIALFQVFFLLVHQSMNRKSWVRLVLTILVAGMFYIPWLPAFYFQFTHVNSSEFYFHGEASLSMLVKAIMGFNFAMFIEGKFNTLIKLLIIAIPGILTLWGYGRSFLKPLQRSFAIAMLGGLSANFVIDQILDTITLSVPKLSFFFSPMAVIFLSIGLTNITRPRMVHRIGVGMCCSLLLLSSFLAFRNKPNFDGPRCLVELRDTLRAFSSRSEQTSPMKSIIVINTDRRRYIFSLLLPLQIEAADVTVRNNMNSDSIDMVIASLLEEQYDRVILMNCCDLDNLSCISSNALQAAIMRIQPNARLAEQTLKESSAFVVFEKETLPQ